MTEIGCKSAVKGEKPQSKSTKKDRAVGKGHVVENGHAGRTCNNASECVNTSEKCCGYQEGLSLESHKNLGCGGITGSHNARLGEWTTS